MAIPMHIPQIDCELRKEGDVAFVQLISWSFLVAHPSSITSAVHRTGDELDEAERWSRLGAMIQEKFPRLICFRS